MSLVERANVEGVYSLSPAQEGMFFHSMLEPASYVEQGMWDIQGSLEPTTFERAWQLLIQRHGILRTVFRQTRRQAVQIVLRESPLSLISVDLQGMSAHEQSEEMQKVGAGELSKPIHIGEGPLFRIVLFRLSEAVWRMLWTYHHIILDGWTLAILLADLVKTYRELKKGNPVEATDEYPFANYLAWLKEQDQVQALGIWEQHLDGFDKPIVMPWVQRNPAVEERTFAAQSIVLPESVVAPLNRFAASHHVTMSVLLQAAWSILLERYSGQSDIVFGLAVSGRPEQLSNVEHIAGPFINTVPVRVFLADDPTLPRLLQSVQRQAVELTGNSYVSLADIQSRSTIKAPASLFSTVLNVHLPVDWDNFQGGDFTLSVARDQAPVARTNYDLVIDVALGPKLVVSFSYVKEEFAAAAIERIAGHFEHVLRAFSQEKDLRVSEIDVLPQGEVHRLLYDFNVTPDVPVSEAVHRRIEEQAEMRPDATAVICGEEARSYAELNSQANQMAHWLRNHKVGPGHHVGIFGERGIGMLTAMLAVWKAGAAFVPLDPDQPNPRIRSILATAGLRCIAVDERQISRAAAIMEDQPDCSVLCWDAPRADTSLHGPERWRGLPDTPLSGPDISDLAYVCYTSGSTGVPKGVMVEHPGMLNHLQAKIQLLSLDTTSVVAQTASHCFDVSVWQFFAVLLAGGKVVIYPRTVAADSFALLQAMQADGITDIETVPVLLANLIAEKAAPGARFDLPALRHMLCTGEALPVESTRRWFEHIPHVPLVNAYGPTECSDDITHLVMKMALSRTASRVPLGRPVTGLRLYVLDEQMRLLPIGCVGQIAASGIGVGRGYLGDAVKTAESFVPDPFAETAGARMYLTGDLGSWNEDGNLELWGRNDGQIKIRGQRIEIGEIENQLMAHPCVRQAVVTLWKGATDTDARLVAYWVGEERPASDLREFAEQVLPPHMVPVQFIHLSSFQLTSSGKIDRRALPEPASLSLAAAPVLAPRNEIEAGIMAIWQEVLDVRDVGIQDSFFELGGHSLKTLQVRARINQKFGVDVSLADVFAQATVERQAALVSAKITKPGSGAGRIPRIGEAEYYPLSRAQKRIWYLHQLDPASGLFVQVAHSLLEGRLNRIALEQAIHGVFQRHAGLRTRFFNADGEPRQSIVRDFRPEVRFVSFSDLANEQQSIALRAMLNEMFCEPFDLQQPPVRMKLVELAPERHLLVAALHHIINDGWSGQIISRDLQQLYAAACQDEKAELPEPPVRYVDFAAWQNALIDSGALKADQEFWLSTLAEEPPELELPYDYKSPAAPTLRVHCESVLMSAEEAAVLAELGHRLQATPFMTRLAVVKAFLHRLTGEENLVLGSPVSGRDNPDVQDVVGFFPNILVFRTDLSNQPTFLELLERIRENALKSYAHQEYPFDLLVEKLKPSRAGERWPLVQAAFLDAPASRSITVDQVTMGSSNEVSEIIVGLQTGVKVPVNVAFISRESGNGSLTWDLILSADRFSGETVKRLARRFTRFVRDLLAHPERRIAGHELLDDGERAEFAIQRTESVGDYPVSFGQRDIWFQSKLHAGNPVHLLCLRARIIGRLDVQLLHRSLRLVIQRHGILRTVFVDSEDGPVQRVLPNLEPGFVTQDCSSLSPQEFDLHVKDRTEELLNICFDLEHGPLVHVEVLQASDCDSLLLVVCHHSVMDALHVAEFHRELCETYEDEIHGREPKPEERSFQFVDFAVWQQKQFNSGLLVPNYAFWRRQLRAPLPAGDFPRQRRLSGHRTYAAKILLHQLSPETLKNVIALTRRRPTTAFRAVMSAYQIALASFTGESDLLFGLMVSTKAKGLKGVLGEYGSTLPIRTRLNFDATFSELLATTNALIETAEAHKVCPLGEVLKNADVGWDPNHPVLPFCISQIGDVASHKGTIELQPYPNTLARSFFDLDVYVLKDSEGLKVGLIYGTELFDASAIASFGRLLESVLREGAADPEKRIGELKRVGTQEERELVEVYAGEKAEEGESRSVIEALERQAAERGAEIAAVCGKERVSYAELNRQANQIGRRLQRAGVGREERVGVLGERGVGMLRAMLGIWKAGGAMVPLDAKQPDARLEKMIGSARVGVLVVGEGLEERGSRLVGAEAASERVVSWERGGEWEQEDGSNVGIERGVSELAYVYYTSGSTGEPKGAMVEEGGLRNHLTAKEKLLGLDERSVIAQTASHCFDIAVWQLMAGLRVGGRVVIYDEETVLEPEVLLAGMEAEGVTVLETVPSLLPVLLEAVERRQKRGQGTGRWRHLLSTGESLPVELCRRWLRSQAEIRLVNVYGPTECSDDVTHHLQEQEPEEQALRVPVGKPIAGAQIYVVDEELRLAPVGCPGEILIGGRCVGRGYSGEGGKTAERFVPDEYGEEGGRLYVTGDRGRWREGGELEFLGRRDSQVKVRGQRVELGEIEAVLAGHGGVKQVAVELRGSRGGEESGGGRLVAYWVGEEGLGEEELKGYVRERLGRAMQPESYVRMEQMPLTPNGKIDRKALPEPAESEKRTTRKFVPPRDEIEFAVTRIWEQELGVAPVGVFDDFFDLGGHSLKAVSLTSQLQKKFGISLPIRSLLENPSVQSISQVIRQLTGRSEAASGGGGCLVQLRAGRSEQPIFLIHPHGGTVFCYHPLAQALGDERPIYGLQALGFNEGEKPYSRIEDMAQHYIKEIRHIQGTGPYSLCGWSMGGWVAYEMARQLELENDDVGFLGILDTVLLALVPEGSEPDVSIGALAADFLGMKKKDFADLNDDEALDLVAETAKNAGMLRVEASRAITRRLIAVLATSTVAMANYRPKNPIRAPITLFRPHESLVEDPGLWAERTTADVEIIHVPGTHHNMVFPPSVARLAEEMQQRLARRSLAVV
jgi:amino acid adenylation domain-containing protein